MTPVLLTVPAHVHHRAAPHGGVLLDRATGQLYALNSTAAELVEVIVAGGEVVEYVDSLAERFPDVPVDRLAADVSRLVEDMICAGLLEVARPARSVRMAEDHPATRRVGRSQAAISIFFVTCAHLLLRVSFPAACRLVRGLRRRRPPARMGTAEELVAAVRWAAGRFPGRTACLETSLAAVLWAAARGVRLDWCIGFTVEPYRFHAWTEVDGKPVMESETFQRLVLF